MIGKASTVQDNAHSLEEKVEFLRHPASYPDATHVEVLETHMSWVFLTDQVVYKLKKPVRYEFLDFTTLDARHKYCVEELHVNKPLAGDTYLGIVPLRAEDGLLRVLRRYDEGNSNQQLVEEVGLNNLFRTKDGRIFRRGEQLRKRFKCLEVKTGKLYLFSPVYPVEVVTAV